MKRLIAIAVALASVVTSAAACSSSGSGSGGSLVIGSADFPENALLANIYADALSAKGVKVSKHLNIGERSTYLTALKSGSIDFIPEYDGSILDFVDPKATAKATADVDAALPAALGGKLTVLKSAPAQNSDTITVTAATASKYSLASIGDLQSVASKLTFGAPAGFKTRPDGIPSLKSVYGVVFGTFTPLNVGGTSTLDALKNGDVDAADIFSTDPSIEQNKLVSLKDDKNMFAAQNIIPLISKSKVTSKITSVCNAVSAKLTTTVLAGLDAQVASGKKSDDVAKAWLKSEGLI